MNLNYTNEIIYSPDGVQCKVLDVTSIDFSHACIGRKSKETIVIKANGNEKIETVSLAGLIESIYDAKPDDAIFVNSEKDMYVPRNLQGQALKFNDIESYGYTITTKAFSYNHHDAVKVKSNTVAKLLPEIIKIPTCIKNAWVKGNTSFYFQWLH